MEVMVGSMTRKRQADYELDHRGLCALAYINGRRSSCPWRPRSARVRRRVSQRFLARVRAAFFAALRCASRRNACASPRPCSRPLALRRTALRVVLDLGGQRAQVVQDSPRRLRGLAAGSGGVDAVGQRPEQGDGGSEATPAAQPAAPGVARRRSRPATTVTPRGGGDTAPHALGAGVVPDGDL